MQKTLSEIKERALTKMLEEMNQSHTHAEDAIHNWLCEQNDDELFAGIMKEDKSIKSAMKYCISQAREESSGNSAMVEDDTVFGWVRDYFINDDIKVNNNVSAKVITGSKPKKKKTETKKKVEKKEELEQMNLFDFM
ncbi:PcfK-like family protein [Enterococcus cecorum]|uniref:Cas9 inhibitor AcrIIA9 family protein n=1 Tax=Enterococcus cecorum TaxID=44008 RepID=UPI001FABFAB7|nr:Cas9 inhibitor AcrIIA9 family protein [Enterococcus cecorum]MCJ0567129.1 PcfK-like family protein [Enterococcus cecorum]MCJ0597198.1 PcfK-like family protein [Enterococcus cecorum]